LRATLDHKWLDISITIDWHIYLGQIAGSYAFWEQSWYSDTFYFSAKALLD